MSDRAAAVLASLRLEARRREVATDLILLRWVAERFLHRISISGHAERLTLKGAFLFAAWEGDLLRSTLDVDLHAPVEDATGAEAMVCEIAALVPPRDDGVAFEPQTCRAVPLIGTRVPGLRVSVGARLGTARLRLRVDMSFGQPISPGPEVRQYPSLLPGFASFPVRAYPRETVVAEKLAVAVEYGRDNTRIRDYWDLWFIASRYRFAGHVLLDSLASTFADRDAGTFVTRRDGYWEAAFGAEYANSRVARSWTDWLERHAPVTARPSFEEAVSCVARFAIPVLCALRDGAGFGGRWSCRHGWTATRQVSSKTQRLDGIPKSCST